jgi:hypothetical protein
MTESLIKINGFPPIILADLPVAKGDTARRKPLILKDGMILAESCLRFEWNGSPGWNRIAPDSGQLPHQPHHVTGPCSQGLSGI